MHTVEKVATIDELEEMLPDDVRDRIDKSLLVMTPTAAALRVLATISAPYWHQYVGPGIDWPPLVERARQREIKISNSERARLEIAASMAGHPGAHVQLLYASRVMARHNYMAVLDALRILAEGLTP